MSLEKKISYPKLIISLVLSFYFLSYISSPYNPEKWNLLDSVDLIFHEAGHTIFIFFGEFIHVLAGSFFQVLIPIVLALYFFVYRREYFSGSILLFWVGQSIVNVSIYVGDAIGQELPLLGGESVIHDWNYLLSSTNLLQYTTILAKLVFATGGIIIVAGCLLSLYFSCYNKKI